MKKPGSNRPQSATDQAPKAVDAFVELIARLIAREHLRRCHELTTPTKEPAKAGKAADPVTLPRKPGKQID